MKQVRRIKLGSRWNKILIYQVNSAGAHEHEPPRLIDIEYTNTHGVLRWMPPHNGTFNLINKAEPQYNLTGYTVTNESGHAENHANNVT